MPVLTVPFFSNPTKCEEEAQRGRKQRNQSADDLSSNKEESFYRLCKRSKKDARMPSEGSELGPTPQPSFRDVILGPQRVNHKDKEGNLLQMSEKGSRYSLEMIFFCSTCS